MIGNGHSLPMRAGYVQSIVYIPQSSTFVAYYAALNRTVLSWESIVFMCMLSKLHWSYTLKSKWKWNRLHKKFKYVFFSSMYNINWLMFNWNLLRNTPRCPLFYLDCILFGFQCVEVCTSYCFKISSRQCTTRCLSYRGFCECVLLTTGFVGVGDDQSWW